MIPAEPRKFIKHVDAIRKCQQDLPSAMKYQKSKANNESGIADSLAQFFSTPYTQYNQFPR